MYLRTAILAGVVSALTVSGAIACPFGKKETIAQQPQPEMSTVAEASQQPAQSSVAAVEPVEAQPAPAQPDAGTDVAQTDQMKAEKPKS